MGQLWQREGPQGFESVDPIRVSVGVFVGRGECE